MIKIVHFQICLTEHRFRIKYVIIGFLVSNKNKKTVVKLHFK
jgi:hypothetical protein